MNVTVSKYLDGKHPGLFHCPLPTALCLVPEDLADVMLDAPLDRWIGDYVVDIKVHMLMPGQYPCIPNWHCDFIPRVDGEQCWDAVDLDDPPKMYLWIDGPPITEFRDGREVVPGEWVTFTQLDEHRGVASEEHCWRTFIRIAPVELLEPAPPEKWLRRHTQVYLDAENFKW